MKVRFEPNEFVVGEEYHGKIVEIGTPAAKELIQAFTEPEVFFPKDGIKHWLENPETAADYAGSDWIDKIDKSLAVDELNARYPTGETYNILGPPTRARDIYYPESQPISQLEEMRDKRVILTLNPLPSKAQMIDLGFNGQMPYAGVVGGWTGDFISKWPDMPGPIILKFTTDYPDCRQHDPQEELALLKKMQAETPNIKVGFCLYRDIGCGIGKKDQWLKVIREADFVTCGCYTYHERYPDAMAELIATADRIEKELDGVPFIPMLQGIWGYVSSDGLKYTKPDVEAQVRFWVERGYHGYIVYCWDDAWQGVNDAQNEWKKWNEWAKEQVSG